MWREEAGEEQGGTEGRGMGADRWRLGHWFRRGLRHWSGGFGLYKHTNSGEGVSV